MKIEFEKLFFTFILLCFALASMNAQVTPLTYLSPQINETSGLINLENRLFTHNDSGDGPFLYELDPENGKVLHTIEISDASHVDWEAICHDDEYIYIGDFGNNTGNRKNLRIYRVSQDSILLANGGQVSADVTQFYYRDQVDFSDQSYATNFDAEAMLVHGDSLYIFTKNWINQKTYIYTLPKTPGDYITEKRDSLDPQGLVTGASYDEDNQDAVLVGYGDNGPFILELDNVDFKNIGNSTLKKTLLNIPNGYSLQTESISSGNDSLKYFITAEKSFLGEAVLYGYKAPTVQTHSSLLDSKNHISPNPASDFINIHIEKFDSIEIYNSGGEKVLSTKKNKISVSHMPHGVYFVHIIDKNYRQPKVIKLQIQ